jgi:hypothetical protein
MAKSPGTGSTLRRLPGSGRRAAGGDLASGIGWLCPNQSADAGSPRDKAAGAGHLRGGSLREPAFLANGRPLVSGIPRWQWRFTFVLARHGRATGHCAGDSGVPATRGTVAYRPPEVQWLTGHQRCDGFPATRGTMACRPPEVPWAAEAARSRSERPRGARSPPAYCRLPAYCRPRGVAACLPVSPMATAPVTPGGLSPLRSVRGRPLGGSGFFCCARWWPTVLFSDQVQVRRRGPRHVPPSRWNRAMPYNGRRSS